MVIAVAACSKGLPPIGSQGGLDVSMSDDQILRVLHLDPTRLKSEKSAGDDGYSTIYTDDNNEIWITRSGVSGVVVMRMRPKEHLKIWELGKPW
jgi:hypothetical protein